MKTLHSPNRRRALLLLPLLAGACTVTPHDPGTRLSTPPAPASETIAPQSGAAQQITAGVIPAADWWTSFGSDKLNALVSAALARNNDLAAAEATLRQAQEQARATAGGQGPQVDASLQSERTRVSRALSNPLTDPNAYLYNFHTAQLSVTYPLDLFGAGRNKVRSARAAADVAAARLVAARTTLVANLTQAVIAHASLAAEVEATRAAIGSDRQLVTLLERRRQLGDVGLADVEAQQTVLANAEAQLPALERQLAHQASLIATLLGVAPGNPVPSLPTLDELSLPATLPLSLPADIVANRPDVRAAEAQMRGAAADLGAAIAARLPSITLSGTGGGSATRFEDMFATGNPFFALIGSISQPIFHSGELLHQKHAAEAALEVAKAQYRAAALQAFLDVDDALAGLRTDATALDAATRADAAARSTLTMTQRQVELGALGTLALLNASATASQTSIQLVQARAARLTDSVALFQATGTTISGTAGKPAGPASQGGR